MSAARLGATTRLQLHAAIKRALAAVEGGAGRYALRAASAAPATLAKPTIIVRQTTVAPAAEQGYFSIGFLVTLAHPSMTQAGEDELDTDVEGLCAVFGRAEGIEWERAEKKTLWDKHLCYDITLTVTGAAPKKKES